MVKDNQDYFKRAGRSGGPRGPLRLFREQYGIQRAELTRESPHPPAAAAPPGPELQLQEVESERPFEGAVGGRPPDERLGGPEAGPRDAGAETRLEGTESETPLEMPEEEPRIAPEIREPDEWTGVPDGRTEMELGLDRNQPNGSAPPELEPTPLSGQPEFGPPASEEYIGPLPEPLASLVRRFPRAFRLLARLTGEPARRFASMADRIERTIESGGR